MTPPTSTAPNNGATRERLLAAQREESRAVTAVVAAQAQLERAESRLKKARSALDAARGDLVRVSGADRAAFLLDVDVRSLRGGRSGTT